MRLKRTLLSNQGQNNECSVHQDDIISYSNPVIILGEPGIGKSFLCEDISFASDYTLISAGQLKRGTGPYKDLTCESKLVIDGLDEITSTSAGDIVDDIFIKLANLNISQFILSCRVADWLGATYKSKIKEDYGSDPEILLINPLNENEAKSLLVYKFPDIDAGKVIQTLQDRGVSEIYNNPLTLILLGQAVQETGLIPQSRADILKQACRAMLKEMNDAHKASVASVTLPEKLLLSAGAISSVLLLTGNAGIYTGSYADTPEDYINIGDIENLPFADFSLAALKTRLFRGQGENRLIPIHRVVAEYLGGNWLSGCLKKSVSPRRILQLIHFRDGVPTSLRGLHAWIAYFNPVQAPAIIKVDPYGVLKYGDSDGLSLVNAKVLLCELEKLSEVDPYFRSEDWDHHSVASIARPELKVEILKILKNPDRAFHLSTLILNAISGSELLRLISFDLKTIMMDETLYYGERSDAANSIKESGAEINWGKIVGELLLRGTADAARLAVRVLIDHKGDGLPVSVIAEAIMQESRLTLSYISDRENRTATSVGSSRILPNVLPLSILPELLDILAKYTAILFPYVGWERKSNCRAVIERSLCLLLESSINIDPRRIWSWIKPLDSDTGYSDDTRKKIIELFSENNDLRRSIQEIALNDVDAGNNTWMRAHSLSEVNFGLYPSIKDVENFLIKLNLVASWTEEDLEYWEDLVRISRSKDGLPQFIKDAVKPAIQREARLKAFYDEVLNAPPPEWEIKQAKRNKKYEEDRQAGFAEHRAYYNNNLKRIFAGEINTLAAIAQGYLGRYRDLNNEVSPHERLVDWLGVDLARQAEDGFITALGRDDLLTVYEFSKNHVDNIEYYTGLVMICGISELIKRGRKIETLDKEVLMATLISWQQFGDNYGDKLQVDVGAAIEDVLLTDKTVIQTYLNTLLTPQVTAHKEHIVGLYPVTRDDRFTDVIIELAIGWLRSIDDLALSIESELINLLICSNNTVEKQKLVAESLAKNSLTDEKRRLWLSAAFVIDFTLVKEELEIIAVRDKEFIWFLRNRLQPYSGTDTVETSVQMCVYIIKFFGDHWPVVDLLGSSRGDTNPHNATMFIRAMIDRIGSNQTDEASKALTMLAIDGPAAYRDYILHTVSQHHKLLRDALYISPSVKDLLSVVNVKTPENIDDLKAYTLDRLDELQKYLRGSDVDSLDVFYKDVVRKLKNGEERVRLEPKDENICRNRIIDLLRKLFVTEIQYFPEVQMPKVKRVDINVIKGSMGVPIEIKGQWHDKVWDAPTAQLDELYTRDWRADGRGIYLALWFGKIPYNNLPRHPDGLVKPETSKELKKMLIDRIPVERRPYIDVFVLDLSIVV